MNEEERKRRAIEDGGVPQDMPNTRSEAEKYNTLALGLPRRSISPWAPDQSMADNINDQNQQIQQAVDVKNIASDNIRSQVEANPVANMSVANQDTISESLAGPPPSAEDEQAIKDDLLTRTQKQMAGMGIGEQKQKSASENFLEALVYFAPTIGAGLAGAAIAGPEAGFAAAKAGQQLNKGYREFQAKQEGGLSVKDKANLTARLMATNVAEDSMQLRGKLGQNLKEYRSGMEERQKAKQEQSYNISKQKLDISKGNQDIALKKMGELNPAQSEAFSKYNQNYDLTKTLEKEFANPEVQKLVGPYTGRKLSMAAMIGAAPDKFTRLKGLTQNLTVERVHDLFGSRVTEAELKQLDGALPSINSTPQQYMTQLKVFQDVIRAQANARGNVLKQATPSKSNTVDNVLKIFNDSGTSNKPSKEEIQAEIKRRGL